MSDENQEDGRFHEFGQPFQAKDDPGLFYRACVICGAMQRREYNIPKWYDFTKEEPSVEFCWQERGNHMLNQFALQLEVQNIVQIGAQASRIQPVAGRIIPN